MSTQTWFITGASSGLGASVANAALRACVYRKSSEPRGMRKCALGTAVRANLSVVGRNLQLSNPKTFCMRPTPDPFDAAGQAPKDGALGRESDGARSKPRWRKRCLAVASALKAGRKFAHLRLELFDHFESCS